MSEKDLSWNLSEELTSKIRYKMLKEGDIFLSPEDHIRAVIEETPALATTAAPLPLTTKLRPCEFVAVVDIISHKTLPYKRQAIKPVYPAVGPIKYVVAMKARVKIIDIRQEHPRVVLHEIIHSNHLINEDVATLDVDNKAWGDEHYNYTSLGIAHSRLGRDIAQRLADYITISRTS
jgi:hypothetical protein